MKTWDKFYPDVLPHVSGCPEPVAEHALLRAAQEYFDTTRAWRMWLPDITTVDTSTTDYFLMLDSYSELVRLERATLNGRTIRVRSEDELPADWKTYTCGIEDGVHTPDGKTLILLPAKDAGQVLKTEASLRPSESAVGLTDDLYARHVTPIAAGAIARIKEHVEQPFTDLLGAQMWRGRFDSAMGTADIRRWRGQSSARPRRMIQTY